MRVILIATVIGWAASASGKWVVLPPSDGRTSLPSKIPTDAKEIKPRDKWVNDNRFRWVIGDVQIPEKIDGAGRLMQLTAMSGTINRTPNWSRPDRERWARQIWKNRWRQIR